MSATIQLRRGTTAEWSTANPVLAIGEVGLNLDDLSYKIGNGVTAWNSLAARELTGIFGSGLTLAAISPPSAPSAGNMALWAQSLAGRIMPRFMGPAGMDSTLQPALWGNSVVLITPSASTALFAMGCAAPTVVGTVSTPAPTTGTNLLTATKRARIASAATANSASELRLAATPVYRGETFGSAKSGGFFFVAHHGMSTNVALQRRIVGLTSSSAAIAVTQSPSALTNCIMLANDSADANMQIMYNDGSGTCTKIDLGANFPASSVTAMYDLTLFAKPDDNDVFYRVLRLDTGAVASGTISTDLPAKTTLLYPHAYANNGGTAAAVQLELMRMYLETDY